MKRRRGDPRGLYTRNLGRPPGRLQPLRNGDLSPQRRESGSENPKERTRRAARNGRGHQQRRASDVMPDVVPTDAPERTCSRQPPHAGAGAPCVAKELRPLQRNRFRLAGQRGHKLASPTFAESARPRNSGISRATGLNAALERCPPRRPSRGGQRGGLQRCVTPAAHNDVQVMLHVGPCGPRDGAARNPRQRCKQLLFGSRDVCRWKLKLCYETQRRECGLLVAAKRSGMLRTSTSAIRRRHFARGSRQDAPETSAPRTKPSTRTNT